MQRCKYLDELGIPIERQGTNFVFDDDSRHEAWAKEREEYGFDERETWCMDKFFIEWIYTRIKMYVDVCCVDLDFHKFQYKGEELTQKQMIDKILSLAEEALLLPGYTFEDDEKFMENAREICDIWKIVMPAMWW